MFQKLTANMFSKRTKTKERWMVQNGVFLWSKLFKTSILKKSTIENIDDKKLYYAVDDLFLFFFLRKVQTIKFCTKIVYHYIDVPTSQSHTKNRLWETTELFEGLSYFISKLPKNKTQFDILQMNEFNANILFILFFRWKRIDKEQREKISIMIKSFVDKHNLKWPKPKFWLHKLGLFLSTKRKIKRVYKHKK
jgi:hypothetical protein